MIALSVILIPSGQTSVQHFVMLQRLMPGRSFEQLGAVGGVERVHLERGDPDEEARAEVAALQLVVAQHVADVLAEEALDALAELADPVDVLLLHQPLRVRRGVNGGMRLFTS